MVGPGRLAEAVVASPTSSCQKRQEVLVLSLGEKMFTVRDVVPPFATKPRVAMFRLDFVVSENVIWANNLWDRDGTTNAPRWG